MGLCSDGVLWWHVVSVFCDSVLWSVVFVCCVGLL